MFEGRSHKAMKRPCCGLLVALQLAGTWIAVAQTDTALSTSRQPPVILVNNNQAKVPCKDRTNPVIAVCPRILDFGSVPVGSTNELSFSVENVGAGILTGAANISGPFRILGGSPYALKHPQTGVITVQYTPNSTGIHMAVVHLTGGDGAVVTVMGSVAPGLPPSRLPKPPARPRVPRPPQNLRMLAGL